MPTNVEYLFRRRHGAFSIERVFDIVASALPEDIAVRHLLVPRETRGFRDIVPNILWTKRNCAGTVHITGDINYCAIGLCGCKTILTIHDLGILCNYGGWRRWLHQKLWYDMPLARCAAVTCVSKTTRDTLLSTVAWKGDVEVIYNPVGDEFIFNQHEFNALSPRILHFNVTPNKNLLGTIDALKGLRCHLRIIGRPTEAQLSLLAENHTDYSWAENLTSEQIVGEYKQCDLLCFPSTSEGFGMPIAEAQKVGRPVITSDRPPMTEVAGEGACFVNPEDVSSIRKGLERIINDASFRNDIVSIGRENAKRFSPSAIASQYAELYR